jgi:hypothetical protein
MQTNSQVKGRESYEGRGEERQIKERGRESDEGIGEKETDEVRGEEKHMKGEG